MATLKHNIDTIALGVNRDPFKVLGPRSARKNWVVRCWQPQAQAVELVTVDEKPLAKMKCIHADGLFEARLPLPTTDYRLRLIEQGNSRVIDDPYRFPSPLGDLDRHLMREGAHLKLDDKLGANLIELDEVKGVHFAVWAPNASRVSVVGSFNDWDGRRHPMRLHLNNGVWDLFIPGMGSGELYKFELLDSAGRLLPLKADPFARRMESPPGNASIVHYDDYQWQDDSWISNRSEKNTLDGPMATYEVHLGSWRRGNNNSFLSYRDLASDLVAYVHEMGYTHIELLPVTEHPFDGSWGYQPIGLFAPTYRFGNPEDFKYFVDFLRLHHLANPFGNRFRNNASNQEYDDCNAGSD